MHIPLIFAFFCTGSSLANSAFDLKIHSFVSSFPNSCFAQGQMQHWAIEIFQLNNRFLRDVSCKMIHLFIWQILQHTENFDTRANSEGLHPRLGRIDKFASFKTEPYQMNSRQSPISALITIQSISSNCSSTVRRNNFAKSEGDLVGKEN